jgi:hypothetical protein
MAVPDEITTTSGLLPMNSRVIGDVIQRQAEEAYVRHIEKGNDASRQAASVNGKDAIQDFRLGLIAFKDKNANLKRLVSPPM